jgi:ubiquinone/menaquinone biosynthesis C-methylase UbiE
MSFDTLAPHYRKMESVLAGNILQRCRTAFLDEAMNCHRALLLGEGPGRFLAELLRANPLVEVTCVERSPGMIEQARRTLGESELARVQFVQADALSWQPLTRPSVTLPVNRNTSSPRPSPPFGTEERVAAGRERRRVWFMGSDGVKGTSAAIGSNLFPQAQFDLVVTHFFLDCFRREELEALVAKVASVSTPDARWLLADFREPERGWRRWRARLVLAVMYGFFRVVTGLSASRLTQPDGFLEAAGFRLAGRRLANFGLAHSDLWLRNAT